MITPKRDYGIKKKGASDDIQELVNYAYKKGGKDFVLTLEAENGLWTTNRVNHAANNSNGHRDVGICMLNRQWHQPFIDSEDFKDPYKQIDYCYGVWKDGISKGRIKTTFYAYNVRHRVEKNFTGL